MQYDELIPDFPLNRFISKVWSLTCPSVHKQEKILPLPAHHFIINLSDEPYRVVRRGDKQVSWTFADGFVSGMQSGYLVIENPAILRHVGVELKPYALTVFTDVDAQAIADTVQESEPILYGSTALKAKVRKTTDTREHMRLLLDFMTEKLPPDYAAPTLVETSLPLLDAMQPIADIAKRLGVSHKHLIHQWKRHAGVTPKQYQNVVRLQQVIGWFDETDKPIHWSSVSGEFSYCDQPYFIRTFRQQTGFAPKEYAHMLDKYPSGSQAFVALDNEYQRLN